jgi:hypothetical protein
MDCPTCFRKLVVPHAPASGSNGFVLTATEVQSRPTSLPGSGAAGASLAPGRKFPLAAIAFGLVICAVGAGVFLWREELLRLAKPQNVLQTNAPTMGAHTGVPALPPSPNWTLNLANAKIPNTPASGSVMGRTFKMERAVIHAGRLDLRQGPKWPPDVGVSIHLFAERSEDLAGKTVVLESTRTNAPRVILRWKDERTNAVTKDFRKGYAARVEFGLVTNNRLAGKIYLAIPDDAKSYAAGTFSAEIRKPTPAKK